MQIKKEYLRRHPWSCQATHWLRPLWRQCPFVQLSRSAGQHSHIKSKWHTWTIDLYESDSDCRLNGSPVKMKMTVTKFHQNYRAWTINLYESSSECRLNGSPVKMNMTVMIFHQNDRTWTIISMKWIKSLLKWVTHENEDESDHVWFLFLQWRVIPTHILKVEIDHWWG